MLCKKLFVKTFFFTKTLNYCRQASPSLDIITFYMPDKMAGGLEFGSDMSFQAYSIPVGHVRY